MKILNINSRATNEIDVALPFETDPQVVAAWDYIIANRRADSFDYRPASEGEDPDRAYMDQYQRSHRSSNPQPAPSPDQVRRIIPKIWQSEMNHDIRELVCQRDTTTFPSAAPEAPTEK